MTGTAVEWCAGCGCDLEPGNTWDLLVNRAGRGGLFFAFCKECGSKLVNREALVAR